MIIQDVPPELQPIHVNTYPPYSNGLYLEQMCHLHFMQKKDNIISDRIYLPVYWTSYFVLNGHSHNTPEIYDWLDSLPKNEKYFTVVQSAHGIWITEHLKNLDIMVFSAGGGGINVFCDANLREVEYKGITRHIFFGKKGTYDLPLIYSPSFPNTKKEKSIYCSFVGRFDTHPCRQIMRNLLEKNPEFEFHEPTNCDAYIDIINKSTFTLAPRGFGYTSFRLYEAFAADSIPVYIWEDKLVLPYQDIIPWKDICIIVHAGDIQRIPQLLANADVQKMRETIKNIKHMFTHERMMDYICEQIEHEENITPSYKKSMKTIYDEAIRSNDVRNEHIFEESELAAFLDIYDKGLCDMPGAMSMVDMCSLYVSLKRVNPTIVIESGVSATYIIRKAVPDAIIVCLNPSSLPHYVWQDTNTKTMYYVGDKYIDFEHFHIPKEGYPYAVFNDKQNQALRMFQAHHKNVKHLFFNNNYPSKCGSFFTLAHLYSEDWKHMNERDLQQLLNHLYGESSPSPNLDTLKNNIISMIDKYLVYSNVFSGKVSTGEGEFDCASAFIDMVDTTTKYSEFYDARTKYRWGTYVKIQTDKRRISVAITHYNNSEFLQESIKDAINDYRVSEIVVCDDKSRDEELVRLSQILTRINCPKIKLHINKVNLGCYLNKIHTVSLCTNIWTILFDSDNILTRDYINRLFKIYNWSVSTIYHPSWAKTFPGQSSPYLDYKKYENQYITPEKFVKYFYETNFQCLVNNCNYFVPVHMFVECMKCVKDNYQRNRIDSVDSVVLFSDWLLCHNHIYIVPGLTYGHRIHPNSNFMLTHRNTNRDEVLAELCEKVKGKLDQFNIAVAPATENTSIEH